MARLNARWLNFASRGQAWTHFWQDGVDSIVVSATVDARITALSQAAAEKRGQAACVALTSPRSQATGNKLSQASCSAVSVPQWQDTANKLGQTTCNPSTVAKCSESYNKLGQADIDFAIVAKGQIGVSKLGQADCLSLTTQATQSQSAKTGTGSAAQFVSVIFATDSAVLLPGNFSYGRLKMVPCQEALKFTSLSE